MIADTLDGVCRDVALLNTAINSDLPFEGFDKQPDLSPEFMQIQHERKMDKHLTAFRNRHPFIDVLPFPHAIQTYYADTSNKTIDVVIPFEAEIMEIDAPESVYFFLSQNKIEPLAEMADGTKPPQYFLVSPTKKRFWVKNITHLYLHIPTQGDAVSFSFWSDI